MLSAKNYSDSALDGLASSVQTSLQAYDLLKEDRFLGNEIQLPTSGWTKNSGFTDYPYQYDLAISGVTEDDYAEVLVAQSSMGTATSCGLSPANQTLAGKVRFYAVKPPASVISATLWLHKGADLDAAEAILTQ